MISLVPLWAKNYDDFWLTVNKRNLWFIKLRYGAVCLLTLLLISAEFFLSLPLTAIQLKAIISITLLILLYNIIIHYSTKFINSNTVFNYLHLSLLQMLLDLVALTLLIYFTGGIENPLFLFYIFHIIIGSLILPGIVIYTLTIIVVFTFSIIVVLEYQQVLPHYAIKGLLSHPVYDDMNFVLAFILMFSLMMFISVVLANNIARQLYEGEKQLYESLNKLKEAEITKQKYIIGVVHEIKSPITAVQSYLDLIVKNYLGPVSIEINEKLNRAIKRTSEAIKMINNVLYISRIKLQEEISLSEISLDEIIADVIADQKMIADSKHICIELINRRKKINLIYGDKLLLQLAFSNIIGNAVKYTGKEGRIEIAVSEEKDKIIIEVCDSGIGIPQEDISKIFNEFYRASNIRKREVEGSGMGLSVVMQIIKSHGGEIKVESPSKFGNKENPGSCFYIYLPL